MSNTLMTLAVGMVLALGMTGRQGNTPPEKASDTGKSVDFQAARPQPRLLLKGSISQDAAGGNTEAFLRDLANHEGRKEWPYLDTNGYVTTGVGHLLADAEAFSGLGWVNKATGAPATPEEIKAGWETLQALKNQGKFGQHFRAEWYSSRVGLTLPDQAVNDLYIKDVRTHADGVRKILGADKFDSAPQPAQEAIVDMAYNMGPGFLNNGVWPKFADAVNRGDWKTAADESRRPKAGDWRNDWTRDKLLAAAAGRGMLRTVLPSGPPDSLATSRLALRQEGDSP